MSVKNLWIYGPTFVHYIPGGVEELRAKVGRTNDMVDRCRHSTPPGIRGLPLPRSEDEPELHTAL